MELAISIIVGVLLVEAYAWLPKISEWLVERAVSQLLAEDQARCREEWKASLDALPNSGLKLLHALSFSWAADRINADSLEGKLEQIGHQLEDLSDEHSCTQQQMRTIKMRVAQLQVKQKNVEHYLGESVTSLRTRVLPAASHVIVQAAVNAYDEFAHRLFALINRATNLSDSQIYRVSAWINQVDRLISAIFEKHADANELLRKRKLSFAELAIVVKKLDDDLLKLRVMVDEYVVEDDARDREFTRIISVLESVCASDLGKTNCNT